MADIDVYKGRNFELEADLGEDVSSSTFAAEMRTQPHNTAPLITAVTVTVIDAGAGIVKFSLTPTQTLAVTQDVGYFDAKRTQGTNIYPLWDGVLKVIFNETVTA